MRYAGSSNSILGICWRAPGPKKKKKRKDHTELRGVSAQKGYLFEEEREKELEEKLRPSRNQERFGEKREGKEIGRRQTGFAQR